MFTVYKEEDAAVQALKKGEVDFVEGIQGLTVQRLQGASGISTHIGLAPGFDEIAFNTGAVNPSTGVPKGDGNPAVQDPAFRHALGYALDRREIISKVYQGLGSPGASIVPAGNPLQWQPPAAEAYHFDLARRVPCSTRPATPRAATGSETCRTAVRSGRCASTPGRTRPRLSAP